ncbi:hypothetical protein OU787_28555 [Kitasatospora sp. YST-16]|nr:hypothetical protein [Kitasatospora sp. YST-16]WAL75126.1 hypothetical protein OU787_28555 [Kitasatospora sp. YST-16]WNW41184.1 hypothetical protein RKE32_28480 [Streptomyces sp. Li-HN-5-13]
MTAFQRGWQRGHAHPATDHPAAGVGDFDRPATDHPATDRGDFDRGERYR